MRIVFNVFAIKKPVYYLLKQFIPFLLCVLCLASCSVPEDEKILKEKYDKLIESVQIPEGKKYIEKIYNEALKELRESKKVKDEGSKIKYSKENDVSTSFFEFCDEIWENENYNPAKFEIKSDEFKYKSVSFTGRISDIISENGITSINFHYKKSKLNNVSRDIIFIVNADTPEQIMHFEKGDNVVVEGVITKCNKSDNGNESYSIYISTPNIQFASNQDSKISKEREENDLRKINDLETLLKLNPSEAVFIFRITEYGSYNSIVIPFAIYYDNKYYEVPSKYNIEGETFKSKLEKRLYELNNLLAEVLVKPQVTPGKKIQLFNNGLHSGEVVSTELTEDGMSAWKIYSAITNEKINSKIASNSSSISSASLNKISPPKLLKDLKSEVNSRRSRDFIDALDINNDGNAEYIYEVGDYEGFHFEIWSFINSKWQLVFEGGYDGV